MSGPLEPDDREPIDGEADVPTPEMERGRAALLTLRDDAPRPMFRARLRRAFAAGTLSPAAPRESATPPIAAVPRQARDVRAERPRWGRVAMQVAMAAGFVVVVGSIGMGMNAGSKWRIAGVTGVGIAVVDGHPIPTNHTEELEQALHPGARVQVPEGCEIGIRCPGTMMIQMTAQTEALVPGIPGRWFGRNVTAEIHSGEWRIVTGPRFAGARLAITTPSAEVAVRGTTLAVICEAPGTCVCVYEGRVRVGRDRSDMVDIEAGRRRYVYLDPAKDMDADVMRADEAESLQQLHDQAMAEMEAGR